MFLPWNIFIIKIFLNNVRSYLKNYIDNSSSLQRTGAGNSQLKQTSSGNRTNFVETFSLVYRLHLEYWSHSVWDCNYLRTHVNTYVQLFRHPPSEKKNEICYTWVLIMIFPFLTQCCQLLWSFCGITAFFPSMLKFS